MRFAKRALSYLAIFLILVLALTAVGTATTPGWKNEPYTNHITVANADTTTAAKGTPTTAEGTYRIRSTTTRVKLTAKVSVDAIIREPIGAPSGRPACLFIHGAGTGKASEVYADLASAMASAGIVTLVPSKRMDTYSTLRRNYSSMAHDYEASLNMLRSLPGVDSTRTGVYAESEGTWISEAMARDDPHIAFMILTSPPAFSGRKQVAMAAASYLNIAGAPEGLNTTVNKILSMNFSPLGPNYADFPSTKYLGDLNMPLLVNYGTDDPSMPIEQGARLIEHATAKAGNHNVTFRYYDANHQMRQGARTSKPGLPLDPNYTKNLEHWTLAVTSGAQADDWQTPHIAGSTPNQSFAVPQAMPSGLVSSLTVLVAALAAALLCLVISGIIALVTSLAGALTHRRRYRLTPGMTVPLLTTTAALLASLCLFFAYVAIAARAALTLSSAATVLHTGWIALHVLALADAALAAWATLKLIRMHRSHRLANAAVTQPSQSWGVSRTCAVTFAAIGCALSLLLLAFFGLFSL